MRNEEAYWITLAHLPRWGYAKINNIIAKFHHDYKISITEFFQLSDLELRDLYYLEEKDIISLNQAKLEIPNNAFIAESLVNEGYELIPIISPEYSNTLKDNLKLQHSPSLLYIKGDKGNLIETDVYNSSTSIFEADSNGSKNYNNDGNICIDISDVIIYSRFNNIIKLDIIIDPLRLN